MTAVGGVRRAGALVLATEVVVARELVVVVAAAIAVLLVGSRRQPEVEKRKIVDGAAASAGMAVSFDAPAILDTGKNEQVRTIVRLQAALDHATSTASGFGLLVVGQAQAWRVVHRPHLTDTLHGAATTLDESQVAEKPRPRRRYALQRQTRLNRSFGLLATLQTVEYKQYLADVGLLFVDISNCSFLVGCDCWVYETYSRRVKLVLRILRRSVCRAST